VKILVAEDSMSQVGRYRDAFAELRREYGLQAEVTFAHSVKGLLDSLRLSRLYDVIFLSGELEDWVERLPFVLFQLSIHGFKGVVVAASADKKMRQTIKFYADTNGLRTAGYTKPNQSDRRLTEIFDVLMAASAPV
jgi:hypothetical protein